MQLVYAILMLLKPAQWCGNHNIIKALRFAIGSSHVHRTRLARPMFDGCHQGVESEISMGERCCSDSCDDFLVICRYEAVVCNGQIKLVEGRF